MYSRELFVVPRKYTRETYDDESSVNPTGARVPVIRIHRNRVSREFRGEYKKTKFELSRLGRIYLCYIDTRISANGVRFNDENVLDRTSVSSRIRGRRNNWLWITTIVVVLVCFAFKRRDDFFKNFLSFIVRPGVSTRISSRCFFVQRSFTDLIHRPHLPKQIWTVR